jgi:hypothetical protein
MTRFILLLLFLFPFITSAQVTKIMGSVTDGESDEKLPFVNIVIQGTIIGALTDFDGNFSVEFTEKADTIIASLIGYSVQKQKFIPHQFQHIDFILFPSAVDLQEVTIRYSGNPADRIMNKVLANKEKNSLQSFSSYTYEAYTKIEIDANNLTERFQNRKLLEPFEFVFSYVDTSTINGKSYLPVFITETMSDIYFRKSPRAKKEIIKATRISGFENESVAHFLGNLSEQVEIYKDHIMIFEKNFVSPAADFCFDFYKYYLVDSLYIGSDWCYHLMFKPRRQQELTFTGNLWIADTSYAIKKVEMRITEEANINYINDMAIRQEFTFTDSSFWMLTKDEVIADFNIIRNSEKVLGFFGHRTVSYQNFVFDPPEEKRFLSQPANVFIEPEANEKTDEYWNNSRHEELSDAEQTIYKMVDSVQNIPLFKTYVDVIYTLVNGYMPWNKVELGPYFKVISFNDLEGCRFRIGARTSNKFSKKLQLEAYAAYGTRDGRFKYGGEVIYMFDKNPRRDITVSFKNDLEQLGISPTAFSTDNILTSLFHRGPNNKLTRVREFKLSYEHEWFNGLINRVHFIHREVFPLGSTEFIVHPDGREQAQLLPYIYSSEISFDLRLSFRERFVTGEFYRYTLSSYYPILLLRYSYGIPDFLKSNYEYNKLTVYLQQWFNFSTIGWSKYMIEAGKIWGTLPYPLLKLHEGNQTFIFDEYASNLMNYYEFVSDRYLAVYYTHHFDGLLFNHLPLIRKLKWREVAYLRCVYGTLKESNREYSEFPGYLRSFGSKPYWEAGAGIENIFRIVRIDAIWRLNHQNDIPHVRTPKFGLFVSLFFSF